MQKKIGLSVVVVMLLAGCGVNQGPSGSHSVAWYAHHPKARQLELHWCNNRSKQRQKDTAACAQASKAQTDAAVGGMFSGFKNGNFF